MGREVSEAATESAQRARVASACQALQGRLVRYADGPVGFVWKERLRDARGSGKEVFVCK